MNTKLLQFVALLGLAAALALLPACTKSDSAGNGASGKKGTHTHADGTTHADDHADDGEADDPAHADDHDHDEVELGSITVDGMTIELAQGHGPLVPGDESHLVVKLPWNDGGQSIVRAWIGGEDRTRSMVGRGEYAESHDDYDVHAMAPDPLPDDAMWWIEVEKPDGTKLVGSIEPLLD